MKVSIIGQAHTFGEVDASRNRKHMYSLRTITRDCEMYEMDAKEFLSQVRNRGRHHDLTDFVKHQDQALANKLAKNIQTIFEGMNIDGARIVKQPKLQIDNEATSTPAVSAHISPTAEALGEKTMLRLRNQISMQSIEAERRMSTIEKGYMYNTKVESQVNNSLVGFEKKIPSVFV